MSLTGQAGASARAEVERRSAAQQERLRQRFGRFAGVAGRIAGEDPNARNWRRGAEGEEQTAAKLGRLLQGRGVVMLHDRLRPGSSRANIDHLAIGSAGVLVIDSKRWKGKARVVGGKLRVSGRDRTRAIAGVRTQVEAVRALLDQIGFVETPVEGAICWLEVDGLPFFGSLRCEGVLIDGPRRIAKHARREGPLTAEQVAVISDSLDRALRRAG